MPDVAQLTLQYITDEGDTFTNGFHFHRTGGWTTTTLGDLLSEVGDAWQESVDNLCTANINLAGCKAVDLSDESGAFADLAYGTPLPGVRSGDAVALHTCMSVTITTIFRGRSYRGRIYHLGLANTDRQDEKHWQGTPAVAVSAGYGTFVTALQTALTCEFGVVSKQIDGVPRTTGVFTEFQALIGRTKIATQRRRLNG